MDIDSSTIFRRPTRQGYNKNQQQPPQNPHPRQNYQNPFKKVAGALGYKRERDNTSHAYIQPKNQRINQITHDQQSNTEYEQEEYFLF